jgi:hypothetical protein
VSFDPRGGSGERRAVAVEVDGVGDGGATVPEQLLLVLLGMPATTAWVRCEWRSTLTVIRGRPARWRTWVHSSSGG